LDDGQRFIRKLNELDGVSHRLLGRQLPEALIATA